MHKLKIPQDGIDIDDINIEYLSKMLKSSQVTIFHNEFLDDFENSFNSFLSEENSIQSVALPSCTAAIYIALRLMNLKTNDEIIIPNITHASTIMAIMQLGDYKIKVCDFEENSYDMNIEHLESLISPKTKVVILSYLHGFVFNIEDVKRICDLYDIAIIEDAAQGLGVKIDNNMAGTIGRYGCFSFGANKLLKMGEGGALSFKDEAELNIINQLRHVGEVWKSSGLSTISTNSTYGDILNNGFDYVKEGFNFRFNPLSVALGIPSLNNLKKTIQVRQKKLNIYQSALKDINGIEPLNTRIDNSAPISAWFIVDPDYFDVNKLILKCIELGIPVGKFKYTTITKVDFFTKHIANMEDSFINSEYINTNSIFLPLYENINLDNIYKISITFKTILNEYKSLSYDRNILNQSIKYFNGFFLK